MSVIAYKGMLLRWGEPVQVSLGIMSTALRRSSRKTTASLNGSIAGHRDILDQNLKRKTSGSDGGTTEEIEQATTRKPKALKSTAAQEAEDTKSDSRLADGKWQKWSAYATSSPYPDFKHPTPQESQQAYDVLNGMHRGAVENELSAPDMPETIPHALDAMIVAVLSQATGWSNAKRAMASLKEVYGSMQAYDQMLDGGKEKLQEALKPGGLHVRKAMILTAMLTQVKEQYGKWDLDHLLEASDEDAMKELMSFKYMGPKSASVVMTWCLKRDRFTVDTHIYRIAGLWGWRPEKATRELTQSHLDAKIPSPLKGMLHFLLIQHGRECPACTAPPKKNGVCEARKLLKSTR